MGGAGFWGLSQPALEGLLHAIPGGCINACRSSFLLARPNNKNIDTTSHSILGITHDTLRREY